MNEVRYAFKQRVNFGNGQGQLMTAPRSGQFGKSYDDVFKTPREAIDNLKIVLRDGTYDIDVDNLVLVKIEVEVVAKNFGHLISLS